MVKQVIVIRKDLNMRKGKMVAQGAHASMAAIMKDAVDMGDHFRINLTPALDDWLRGIFTKVVVGVESENELLRIVDAAEDAGVKWSLIKDAGKTEFHGVPTYTAVAIGPDEEEKIDKITGHLKLL